jgi:hypothetical protein
MNLQNMITIHNITGALSGDITYHFLEFSLKCQAYYLPDQRAIVSSSGETLFTITPKTINQMMQIPRNDSLTPFSIDILTKLY